MSPTLSRYALPLAACFVLACGTDDQPVTGPSLAKGPGGSQFSAAPAAVEFSFPPGGSAIVTVSAQYLTTVTSATSNASCATVSPASVPTRKPKSSSAYVATFTVTAAGAGTCEITLTEKNGKTATVQVTVVPPLPDRIVYASDEFGGADVFIMDLDGANKTRLTSNPDAFEYQPTLSPDGRRIGYHQDVSNVVTGWIMASDGSGKVQLPIPNMGSAPSIAPGNLRMAYSAYVNGWSRIFTADLNGANPVQLTSAEDFPWQTMPVWSGPHPGRIVYIQESPRGIYIMNPDGSGQTRVTADLDPWLHGLPGSASLSPDGQKIVWDCQPTTHVFDICTINVDGTGKVALTDAPGDDRFPRWTRDGRIVFTSERDGDLEVYIMNADGTGQVNLTNSSGTRESTGRFF